MRRADREHDVGLGEQRVDGPDVAKRGCARARVSSLRPSGAHDDLCVDPRTDRRAHLARVQQPDDHKTSASTKAKKATEMTPFIVKNAASSRRRSPGRTSECS